ncbi:MAG: hypothetical protein GX620_13405 [Chloroflexi bacterium]|nr:hypothetical protein [Chloroflexota bacterium]
MIRMIRQRVPLTELGWLRLAVIAGLLVGLLVIGVATTRVPLEMVMAAAVVPPVLILTLTGSREYGVLAIILAAGFVRFSLPTGTESRIVISLLVTGVFIALWVARMLMGERRLHLSPSNTTAPLLAFIITAVISYGWSNVFRDPLVIVWKSWPFVQLGGLAVLVLLPGAFLLTVNTISEVRWLKLLFGSIILIGVLSLADYLLPVSIPFLTQEGYSPCGSCRLHTRRRCSMGDSLTGHGWRF